MESKNIILWGILAVCVVVMFVSINAMNGNLNGDKSTSFDVSPKLKDKIDKESLNKKNISKNKNESSNKNVSEKEKADIPSELKHRMRGPYLFTGGGVVRIANISETEKPKINLKDERGNINIKGVKISSKKILKHIRAEAPDISKGEVEIISKEGRVIGVSIDDVEIISKEDHIKILDRKNKITKVIYLDSDGDVTEEISIAGIIEEKDDKKPSILKIDQLHPKRDLRNVTREHPIVDVVEDENNEKTKYSRN